MPSRRVLLVPGSLRGRSTNVAALRSAHALAPDGVEAVLYEGLGELPHFNPDDDVQTLHPAVAQLRDEIHRADALLFSTPEYAGGLPGSFKNLLDWTIGDEQPRSIAEKPVAWINCSPRGAEHAVSSLRTVLGYAHATVIDAACADVPLTSAMIGEDGLISDAAVRDTIHRVLIELAAAAMGL